MQKSLVSVAQEESGRITKWSSTLNSMFNNLLWKRRTVNVNSYEYN
jgi:hypothetical protein